MKTMKTTDKKGWLAQAKTGIKSLGLALAATFAIQTATAGVAKIGTTEYDSIAEAVTKADVGQTINIFAEGTYTLPNIPKNITLKAADGVVYNCEGPGNSSICSIPNGCTFEGGVFNMGQNGYHGWWEAGHIWMNGCTLNGLFLSYGDMTFTGCHFVQTKAEYNMWTYGGNISYVNCDFTFKGKCINVYRESATPYEVSFSGCKFNSDTKNKAAVNVKATCSNGAILSYTVNVTDCQVNDPAMFPAPAPLNGGLLVIDGLVQVDDIDEAHQPDNTTVFFNGKAAYPAAAKPAVAKIGTTEYDTIEAAIVDSQKGDVIEVLVPSIELTNLTKADLSFKGDGTTKVTKMPSNGDSFCGDNLTFDGFEFTVAVNSESCKNFTVRNSTFTGGNGIRNGYAKGDVLFENCVFDTTTYGLHFDSGAGTVTVSDCTFKAGFNTFGEQISAYRFVNCQFQDSAKNLYYVLQFHGTNVKIDGCDFFGKWCVLSDYQTVGIADGTGTVEMNGCRVATGTVAGLCGYSATTGVVAIDATKDESGNYLSGTFVKGEAVEIPLANGCQLFPQGGNVYVIGTMIDPGTGDKTVPALEQQSGSSVDEKKLDQVVQDQTIKDAIKQETVVSGVKLTTTPKMSGETEVAPAGMQAVVNAAKAKNPELATALEAETASMVTVAVDVAVSPVTFEGETEALQSVAAFKLDPKATVTVVNTTGTGTEAVTTSKSETVPVSNDMIDQTAGIAVTIVTGFKPEMIVHKDENGKVIETFTADQIVWNAEKKTATVTITHFSTLEAVKVSYAAEAEGSVYATLAEAFDAVEAGHSWTVKVLTDLTLAEGVTFAAGKTATLDFADRTITGGTITSAGALTLTGGTMNSALACDGGTMAITGGDYTTALPGTTSTVTNGGPFFVSGGTFVSAIPWAYCAPGYEPQEKTGGKFGVKDANIFIRDIKAAQRYPWNGYVDITLDVCWSTKETARLFIEAYEGEGTEHPLSMASATMLDADGSEIEGTCAGGYVITAPTKKTIHLMWNSDAAGAVPSRVAEGVHFKFIAK